MIRLSRVGKTKQPSYRLIVSEKTKDPWGDYLEALGFFDPLANPPKATFKAERITYWISKGAQVSDTAHNLLVDNGVLNEKKRLVKHSKVKPAEEGAPSPAAKAGQAAPTPGAAGVGVPTASVGTKAPKIKPAEEKK